MLGSTRVRSLTKRVLFKETHRCAKDRGEEIIVQGLGGIEASDVEKLVFDHASHVAGTHYNGVVQEVCFLGQAE